MKIFIGIILGLAGIVALLLVIGFFVKKDYAVGVDVVVNKSKTAVFDYLRLLKNQNKFSVWASMDPNMKTEFRGTDGTEGFV